MSKKASMFVGVVLISLGLMTTGLTFGLPMLGIHSFRFFQLWRYWPLTVMSVGLGFVLPPLFYHGRRGLGGLFIPGVPILATGAVLFFTSVLGWWGAWSWLWPVEVLSVAVGFALAAAYMRVIWLLIPAFIVGANGLLFQFCAITNLWSVWAVMWTIEPLSLGLALLLIGSVKKRPGTATAGIILCSIGSVGLIGMSALLSMTWLASWMWAVRFVAPVILVLSGLLLLLMGLSRNTRSFKAGE